MTRRSNLQIVKPFQRNSKQTDIRTHLNGAALLGQLEKHLEAFTQIDKELNDSIQDFEREILDQDGKVIRTDHYRSTILDKETISADFCGNTGASRRHRFHKRVA